MTTKLDVCQLLRYFEAKYDYVVGLFCLNISHRQHCEHSLQLYDSQRYCTEDA